MALKKNMSLTRIRSFLGEELKEQILLEIAPILHIGQEQGGYFGSSRQILCFIDFLGSLYVGYDEKKDSKFIKSEGKKRLISKPGQAIMFIKDFMGEKIDQFYKINGEVLYKMYRNGLVHLYQPKSFRRQNGNELRWFAYKGPREKHLEKTEENGKIIEIKDVRHVAIIPHPEKSHVEYLAVSVNCLYYDLIQAIDIYLAMLEQDKALQAKFISTANAICDLEKL